MKDLLLKILEGFINALSEILDLLFGPSKKQYKKTERPTSISQPLVQPSQEEKQPVNVLVPVEEPPLYKRSPSILTYQERKLLLVIRKAIADEYIILMKVRMGDFIYVTNKPNDGTYYPNKVMYKHADFLLCGKRRVEPLLVIELDDSSHKFPERIESDKIKNETCDAVGLPYLRIELQKWYDTDELRMQIKEKILDEAPLFDSDTRE